MNRIEVDIHVAKSGNICARRLLAEGKAAREDRLVLTRDGKPAISATVGWWADHVVREDPNRGLWVERWKPFPSRGVWARMAKDESQVG
jgi:hypothetical protein